jgi:hypothetical protein
MGGILGALLEKLLKSGAGPMSISLFAVAASAYALFQVSGVQSGLARVEQGQLETKLQEHYRVVCMSPNNGVDQRLWDLIKELERRYKEVSGGQPYQPTPCDLLLKLK